MSIIEVMPTWTSTLPDLKVALKLLKSIDVLRNKNKEKIIPIVLLIQEQIMVISRFNVLFQSNQITQVEEAVF